MFDCPISGELLVEEVGQVSLPEGAAGTPTALTSQGSLLCLLQGGNLGQKHSDYGKTQGSSMCGCQKYDFVQTQRCSNCSFSTQLNLITFHLTTLHLIIFQPITFYLTTFYIFDNTPSDKITMTKRYHPPDHHCWHFLGGRSGDTSTAAFFRTRQVPGFANIITFTFACTRY